MNLVTFPGFGINLNINSILFSYGNIKIYWYGFLIVCSFIIGLLLLKKFSKDYEIKIDNILELFILLVPIGIICARVYYVLFNLDYYKNNIGEIFKISSGGLAVYGGIIGCIITIYIYSKVRKIKFLKILDLFALVLPLGQAIGRWGNFFNSEAYGSKTNSIFRMGIIENNEYIEVHPTFLYESICCLFIFFILQKVNKNKKYDGNVVYTYLFLYGIVRNFIETLRQDSLMIGNIKISLVISVIFSVIFGALLIYNKVKNNRKNKEEKKV